MTALRQHLNKVGHHKLESRKPLTPLGLVLGAGALGVVAAFSVLSVAFQSSAPVLTRGKPVSRGPSKGA